MWIRVSNTLLEYRRRTLSVDALQRADRHDLHKQPWEDVRFIGGDDDAGRTAERIRLAVEGREVVDVEYYTEQLLRAAESVLTPLGWKWADIDRFRSGRVDGTLAMH